MLTRRIALTLLASVALAAPALAGPSEERKDARDRVEEREIDREIDKGGPDVQKRIDKILDKHDRDTERERTEHNHGRETKDR